jgi:hypothetical protein
MPQVANNLGGCTDAPTINRITDSHSAIRRGILVLVISACALLFGCSNAVTIWSTESRSPDGQWRAIARTDQYSGPGNAALLTTVYLKAAKGRKDETQVLLLMQNERSIGLKMNWSSPSHLEVTYKQPAEVEFQAIKCAGIDISVHDLSSGTMSSSQ